MQQRSHSGSNYWRPNRGGWIVWCWRNTKAAESAELYLLLCEVGYNLLRTATYATLCMLDRAFQECELRCVAADVNTEQREYLAALERMGFCIIRENRRTITVVVQKEMYLNNRFLF